MEPFQVKEVLRCLVHSILFNRALGSFQPRDAECTAVDNIAYVRNEACCCCCRWSSIRSTLI